MADAGRSDPDAKADQVERYYFEVTFPGSNFPSAYVDESPPIGTGRGPSPVRVLAAAVAHCMSSTLFNTLERARVPSSPIHTSVWAEVGRNPAGRLRVLRMSVSIRAAPLQEADRSRFERCVEVFQDYCTVSGAVREGIEIGTTVVPPDAGTA